MTSAARELPNAASCRRADGTFLYEMLPGYDGILRVRTAGFWSLEEADAYLADLGRVVAQARGSAQIARVLTDLRQSSIQSAEVMARLATADWTVFGPRDWRAFIVESRLKMMQLRRGVLFAGSQAFASPVDAERWLEERR